MFNIYTYENGLYAIKRIDGAHVSGMDLQDDSRGAHAFCIIRMNGYTTDVYDFVTWYVVYQRIIHKRDIKTIGDVMLLVEGKEMQPRFTEFYDNRDFHFKILKKVFGE